MSTGIKLSDVPDWAASMQASMGEVQALCALLRERLPSAAKRGAGLPAPPPILVKPTPPPPAWTAPTPKAASRPSVKIINFAKVELEVAGTAPGAAATAMPYIQNADVAVKVRKCHPLCSMNWPISYRL